MTFTEEMSAKAEAYAAAFSQSSRVYKAGARAALDSELIGLIEVVLIWYTGHGADLPAESPAHRALTALKEARK